MTKTQLHTLNNTTNYNNLNRDITGDKEHDLLEDIISNLSLLPIYATNDPTTSNTGDNGQLWINANTEETFILTDNTNNIWKPFLTSANLDAETQARIDADNALENKIDDEIQDRITDVSDIYNELDLKENKSEKGVANGYCALDNNALVPSSNLPSYVDDVLEFATLNDFPSTGETGKIYVALDTNITYRWSGSSYIEISASKVLSVNGYDGTVELNSNDIEYDNGKTLQDIKNAYDETLFWNGFNLQDSLSLPSISFDEQSRVVTVEPTTTNYWYWEDGLKQVETVTKTVIIPDVTDNYYIYLDNGTLSYIEASNMTKAIMLNKPLVALIMWFSDIQTGYIQNEKHGIRMSGTTHMYNHLTFGARYQTGFSITGLSSGDSTFSGVTSGILWDEDIQHIITNTTTSRSLYLTGNGNWTLNLSDDKLGIKETGNTYYSWNKFDGVNWVLEEATFSTDFFITFFVKIPVLDDNNTTFKIIGQNAYSNRTKARNAIGTELNKLLIDGLPNEEFIFIGAVIIDKNGKLQTLNDGSLYLDLRSANGGSGGASHTYITANDVISTNGNVQDDLDNLDNSINNLDTDSVTEAGNLYYTDTRVSNNTDVINNKNHTLNTSNPHGVTKTQLNIYSGTYTPTMITSSNLAGYDFYTTMYQRIGNIVTVTGTIHLEASSTGLTVASISIPYSSNFTLTTHEEVTGIAYNKSSNITGRIIADTTNNSAQIRYDAMDTIDNSFQFTFTYKIV